MCAVSYTDSGQTKMLIKYNAPHRFVQTHCLDHPMVRYQIVCWKAVVLVFEANAHAVDDGAKEAIILDITAMLVHTNLVLGLFLFVSFHNKHGIIVGIVGCLCCNVICLGRQFKASCVFQIARNEL